MKKLILHYRKKNCDFIILYDNEDEKLISKHSWFVIQNCNLFYVITKNTETQKTISMHRLVMGFPKGKQIDHIKHYDLDLVKGTLIDNRKSNLRECTGSENQANQRKRCDNKSGYRGVCYKPEQRKYHAQIQVNKKNMSLGFFASPIEAAKAYNKAAKKYFGEFANLNRL